MVVASIESIGQTLRIRINKNRTFEKGWVVTSLLGFMSGEEHVYAWLLILYLNIMESRETSEHLCKAYDI